MDNIAICVFPCICSFHLYSICIVLVNPKFDITRVPTFTGKPGKMRVHLENLEKSWNFAKKNKNHGKITWNLEKYLGRL